jgi:plasmid segregation protein ParM
MSTKKTQTADASVEQDALLVAIDDGYAQTKLVGESPDGTLTKFMTRSSVRSGRYGLVSLSGTGGIGSYETEEGETFTVSEDIESEGTQFDSFHVSTMNRVLVNHALMAAGYSGKSVRLITGLPVADYFFDGLRDEEKIAAKRANLLKGVANTASNHPVAKLVGVRVGCQAVAAFVDYYLDDQYNERDVPVGKVAVVDVGGRTTDVAMIRNGSEFDDAVSGTANLGVLDVYKSLSKAVRTHFRTRDEYPLTVLDAAVRSKTITLWGEKHDIAALVDDVVQEQEVKIAREVERRLGTASSVDRVLFVGGGSALFANIASHFKNGQMAPDPEFANARGLFKFAKKFGD